MMNRYITVVLLVLGFSAVSCDKEYPFDYYRCHCHGNGIGGWEDQNDTTVTNRKDTVGGFEITVEEWEEYDRHDIHL